MRTLACLAILCFATTTNAAPAAQADAASARAYLSALYHRYEHEHTFGVFGDREGQFFDASTLALLRQDEKLLAGEEGAIGADYLCVCQDSDGMKATIGAVDMAGANAAKAQVSVRFTAERGTPAAHVAIDLAFEKGAWRIHDVHPKDPDGQAWDGLRDVLVKEIRELSAGH